MRSMIKRKEIIHNIKSALDRGRIVSLLGPRQCGKTTLARQFAKPGSLAYFDLEDPVDTAKLIEPKNTLQNLKGIVVIDEIQRQPELFSLLRVLADRDPLPAKFLILGSASPSLSKHASESLAGRVERIEIGGFSFNEIGKRKINQLWLRGGFPRSFLSNTDKDAFIWLNEYIKSFVERDLPLHGVSLPPLTLMRFWAMLAHYHGQIFNANEIARSLGISVMTIRRYLDIMTGVFIIRQLQPWHVNIKKRQVKSPKIYFNDTGLLHALLGIQNNEDLLSHPKYGASWEGFVLEQLLCLLKIDYPYFWATHQGSEIDLVFNKGGRMYGIEIKRSDAPTMTTSMKNALQDLKLERIIVIYPGDRAYPINEKVDVVPFDDIEGIERFTG